MALVLLLAAWLGWTIHRARVQGDAVAAIEQAGGRVEYDGVRPDRYTFRIHDDIAPPGPRWLHAYVGRDFFVTATAVWLTADRPTDALLSYVGRLERLEELFLGSDATITDGQLKYLASLTRLKRLDLDRTNITDAGLEHLAGLSRLEFLKLRNTAVTNAGLKQLAGLTRLRTLYLNDTPVTRDGVEALRRTLPQLEVYGRFPESRADPHDDLRR